ncbi:PDZ domain-containing RING finger protein 4 isoform X1 [Onthophagus taurus]|uniref:PDZ domain-containing RING finger protein 4 isoform X1 n=2 Tax=Onthophagus taurus TaxID=166361 RepID=UPI0039BE58A7
MDFLILKINGTDVSGFPHQDAVRAFLAAQEPIVVEIKRRTVPEDGAASDVVIPQSNFTSTAVQTDISAANWPDENILDCPEIDLEEVTLRKCSSEEKLGLTVCYSSGSDVDTCTEVYIRDIVPQSVADLDGRLRQGDQILQVNGKDVANREETESLFAENRKAVTLLISRCYNKYDDYMEPEDLECISGRTAAYQNTVIEQIIQRQAENQQSPSKNEPSPRVPPHFSADKFTLTNSLVRSKLDSINHEISELNDRMQSIQLVKTDRRKHVPPESDTEHIYETIPESSDFDILEPLYSCPYDEENPVEQWLITQENSFSPEIKDMKDSRKGKVKSKSLKSNSSGEEHENSSSAYNTGGSSNSNHLTFELACNADSKQKNIYKSTLVLCPNKPEEEPKQSNCDTKNQSKQKKPKQTKSSPTLKPTIANILSDTMYTNVANLQQTMLLQQQLFRQTLGHQSAGAECQTSNNFNQFQNSDEGHTKMEWKVKRRPDGTRYIARRPVRNRILRDRAMKITEERCGLTTEDDTLSELKIGRYWTKEERKKHVEKSKERKQRQEILQAARHLDENVETQHPKDKLVSKKTTNNIDNTAKKYKAKKVHTYDNFSTVQDVLLHGPKSVPNQNSKMIGLLSVTTV